MNHVRLSGFIVDEIDLRRHADGTESASVSLRFSQGCGPLLRCCFGAATHHLSKCKPGDAITIFGRLVVGRHNGKPSVVVSEAHYLDPAKEWPKERERDLSSALHSFAAHASIPGVKNARPGPR
jgi:hypothetical protein